VQKIFDLTISEDLDIFANIPELEPSISLTDFLAEHAQLALKINTEKARSEIYCADFTEFQEAGFLENKLVFGS
jgi:hypothetical protein